MSIDSDIHVWLETQQQSGQTVVIPYVRMITPRKIHYVIAMKKSGSNGSSETRQSGDLLAKSDKATPMAQLSVNVMPSDACNLVIDLSDGTIALGNYKFSCPHWK